MTKVVIISTSKAGCMIGNHQVSREIAECMIEQYRHPALGWRETTRKEDDLHIFIYEDIQDFLDKLSGRK